MNKQFYSTVMLAGLCAVQLVACSSGPPPKTEVLTVENSISAAIDSGAETAAPDELQDAQNKLAKARKLIRKKKYDHAKKWLTHANTSATLALRTAEAGSTKTEMLAMSAQTALLKRKISDREGKLQEKEQELEALKELQAKHTDRGMVLTLGDVLFNTGESTLNYGAQNKIDRIAEFMQKYPERNIVIEGHTDNVGDEEFNHSLSLNRAVAVMAALRDRQIDSQRISTQGKGEYYPLADNSSEAGRQQNRRVEIIFDHENTMLSDLDE